MRDRKRGPQMGPELERLRRVKKFVYFFFWTLAKIVTNGLFGVIVIVIVIFDGRLFRVAIVGKVVVVFG